MIHCPFCHGYEVRDLRVVQVITHPMGLHPAVLFRQLSSRLTLLLHDAVAADHPQLDVLRAAGVVVVDQKVRRVVTGREGRIAAVELADGELVAADAVVVGTRFRVRAEIVASIGVQPVEHLTGLGDFIETNQAGETSVPGIYAAGNVTDPSQQMLHAAAQGSWVAGMIAFSLANEDTQSAARPSGNESDWDHRYSGEQMWSGNPNGALVHEAASMTIGASLGQPASGQTFARALDVGAGEGGDAVWLAEQGWHVTATDISQRALYQITAIAKERNLPIECLHSDANALHAYESAAFDLVTAHYASIPRTPDHRGVVNLMGAVSPGGTLLIVSHDLEPMRVPINTHEHSRPFDPDAYVRVDDFLDALNRAPNWTIETHERRQRPPGASTHHVHDIVLRARRHAD